MVTESGSGKAYVLKRLTCHSTEDQIAAQKEMDFHDAFDHPAVLKCVHGKG